MKCTPKQYRTFGKIWNDLINYKTPARENVLRGSLPKSVYQIFPQKFQKCCVCGFMEQHGVTVENNGSKRFCCIRDFENPANFFKEKLISAKGVHYNPKKGIENWIVN